MRIRIQQLFLNADLDPDLAAFLMRIRIQLEQICKNYFMKSFLQFKRKNHGAGPNLL